MNKSSPNRPVSAPDMASWRQLDASEGMKRSSFLSMVGIFSLIVIAVQLGMWLVDAKDYVGVDPDDTMRLVEVRDYLGGQGWFDLNQYRLGPDGGTLMHWSRLIDWPIAQLIRFFGLFLAPQAAEAAALAVWPLLLVVPLVAATALASYRLAGKGAVLIGLILALVFMAAIVRFRPGAIDHHNVQLVLVVFIAAMLIDPMARVSNYAAAAAAGALALAIGAETTPIIAVAAMAVAVLWAVKGEAYRRATIGFGAGFAAITGAIFLATTPLRLWSSVTCDTLSVGYLALAASGGAMLAGCAALLTQKSMAVRLGSLAVTGVVVGLVALIVAPQCLSSPLSNLDPLLKTYWISSISEAQSLGAQLAISPQDIGAFYAVGIIAAAVSVMRIMRGEQVVAYGVFLALVVVSWVVSAVQVRGMLFANYLAFVPLSALVADLRKLYLTQRNDGRAATAFVVSALLSVPSVWSIVGVVAFDPVNAIAATSQPENAAKDSDVDKVCVTADTIKDFAAMPPGRILAGFNEGPALLRFTPHSVLGANYHRNQRGMIASLQIGMTDAADAIERLEAENIRYILFCDGAAMLEQVGKDYPRGLFAALLKGDVPGYLEELPRAKGGPRIYEIIQR